MTSKQSQALTDLRKFRIEEKLTPEELKKKRKLEAYIKKHGVHPDVDKNGNFFNSVIDRAINLVTKKAKQPTINPIDELIKFKK